MLERWQYNSYSRTTVWNRPSTCMNEDEEEEENNNIAGWLVRDYRRIKYRRLYVTSVNVSFCKQFTSFCYKINREMYQK